ncbi:MAG: D-glycero-beta-D-manno-heptose-7-phosphate kinase [Vicingaceae bacterium]
MQLNENLITRIFNDFNKLKVLIVGDVMMDAYYKGKVERISPEAPVPIVNVEEKENRLGGAANVAINVKELGATPILCSVVGNDENSAIFKHLLKDNNLSPEGILTLNNRITTVKTRVIGNNHQLIRIDEEDENDLTEEEGEQLLHKIAHIVENQTIDVIIFEDYNKGVLTKEVIEAILLMAKSKNIPTAVDPKKKNFFEYKHTSLFKPNLKELKEAYNVEISKDDLETLKQTLDRLQQDLATEICFVTLSSNGVAIQKDEFLHTPAHVRKIADVSGAGDTVISVASLCLALNLTPTVIAELSNLAGGLVCEKVGVSPINKTQFLNEALLKLT